MKKIPMRKCLATQELCPKQELIRVVKNNLGEEFFDTTGRAIGRGAYLKKDKEAIDKAVKSNCLGRALECKIPEEVYQTLYGLVSK